RTWELARRRSVSPHDSLGANLVVQVKGDEVLRVVPFENEAINECWISDRDRFSYEGLNSEDRLALPMIKNADGSWREASWSDALQAAAQGLTRVRDGAGAGQIGALATEYATTEEFALLGRLVRALGSENIDFRLRQTDAGFDAALSGAPWLGMPIAEVGNLDRVLIVGSFLRKDHPLIAQRLRQAAKHGTQVLLIDGSADNQLMSVTARITTAPSGMANALAEVAVALAQAKSAAVPAEFSQVTPSEEAKRIAASLASGSNTAVLLGNMAVNSPAASTLAANAGVLATLAGGKLGFLTAGGNTVGGYLAGAVPERGGKTAAAMLAEPLKAYVVLHAEPLLDADNGPQAVAALKGAFSVALTSYRSAAQDWADVMLPVAPFTETSGTFINAAGTAQSFKGTVAPLGESRPGWKVLRVMGNVLQLPGFEDESSESVRDAVLTGGIEARLSNQIKAAPAARAASGSLERLADVPIYRSDAIVRRSGPLQAAPASSAPVARINGATLSQLGLSAGAQVRVKSAAGSVVLEAVQDDTVAARAVRIATAFEQTAPLGGAFGEISVERA
ncbi:MAG TPA: molybdopterin-dependent oxidoreductase, partial [Bordetella sp.]|uniref:molybdopterin-dependent oxidoreductase n=1 Tax=Bordetella sp. TaxID=28081 RepID=UPI002ED1294E